MAQNTISIGTSPNDGLGDPIRTAFSKVNQNFDEMYSSFIATGKITVGNSTVNTAISNTGGLVVSNSIVSTVANSTSIKVGNSITNSVLSSSQLTIASNVSVNSSSVVNTIAINVGNSTVNAYLSQNTLLISTSTSNVRSNSSVILIGNSTVNASINSSIIQITSANIVSNTGLMLGSSTAAANGYTFLPNGLKMNWGWVSANDSSGTALFTPNFTTNAYSVTATSNATGTYQAAVISWDNTSAQIRTANQTSTNVFWMAIGK